LINYNNKSIDIDKELLSIYLPSVISSRDLSSLSIDLEFAAAFTFAEYDRRRNDLLKNSTYVNFGKYLWPMILIQSKNDKYLLIDYLSFFSLKFNIHIFNSSFPSMNIGNDILDLKNLIDEVEGIKKFLLNEHIETRTLNGLVEPEVLKGIAPLFKIKAEFKPSFETKMLINPLQKNPLLILNQYNDSIELIKNNLKIIQQIIEYLKARRDEIKAIISNKYLKSPMIKNLDLNEPANVDQINQFLQDIEKLIEIGIILYKNIESELEYLTRWSIPGAANNLVLPIAQIWFPIYISQIETVNKEIKLIIVPPLILQHKSERPVRADLFHPSFLTSIKDRIENNLFFINQFIPYDKRINLFSIKEVNKFINDGFTKLSSQSIIDAKLLNHVQSIWNENINKSEINSQ